MRVWGCTLPGSVVDPYYQFDLSTQRKRDGNSFTLPEFQPQPSSSSSSDFINNQQQEEDDEKRDRDGRMTPTSFSLPSHLITPPARSASTPLSIRGSVGTLQPQSISHNKIWFIFKHFLRSKSWESKGKIASFCSQLSSSHRFGLTKGEIFLLHQGIRIFNTSFQNNTILSSCDMKTLAKEFLDHVEVEKGDEEEDDFLSPNHQSRRGELQQIHPFSHSLDADWKFLLLCSHLHHCLSPLDLCILVSFLLNISTPDNPIKQLVFDYVRSKICYDS